MQQVGTVVIGLGSVGAMALWQLARSGETSVLGIEQYDRVHAHGAYVGESRLFRVATKENPLYPPLALRSRELYEELEREADREILLRTGALSIGPRDLPELATTLRTISDFDLPHRILDAADLRAQYPQFVIDDDDFGIMDELGGATRPETAVLSAIRAAQRHGAEVRTHTRVEGIDADAHGVTVTTDGGVIRADRVIVTAGPWAKSLLPELDGVVKVRYFALTWFVPEDPAAFAPDVFPGFMRDRAGVHAFGVPSLDGFSIKLSPDFNTDPVPYLLDSEPVLSAEQARLAGEQARSIVPGIVPEPIRVSYHPDGVTEGSFPVIDTLADGRVTVVAGLSGNGFKFAPVYGQIAAELATTGESALRHPSFRLAEHTARLSDGQ